MASVGELVARLIAAGTPPDVAAVAITEAFAAGVATVTPQKSGGNSAEIHTDSQAERRRAKDRERYQLRRNSADSAEIPQKSAEIPNPPIKDILSLEDSGSSKTEKKESRRGSRIPPDWLPSATDIEFAISKGMSRQRVDTEVEKFKNYWGAKTQDATKLDWSKTWRNWVINWADRNPAARADEGTQYLASRQ